MNSPSTGIPTFRRPRGQAKSRSRRFSASADEAAVDRDRRASDEGGVVGREEEADAGDVVGRLDPVDVLHAQVEHPLAGKLSRNHWQIRARVEVFGNDPDTDWIDTRVGAKQ